MALWDTKKLQRNDAILLLLSLSLSLLVTSNLYTVSISISVIWYSLLFQVCTFSVMTVLMFVLLNQGPKVTTKLFSGYQGQEDAAKAESDINISSTIQEFSVIMEGLVDCFTCSGNSVNVSCKFQFHLFSFLKSSWAMLSFFIICLLANYLCFLVSTSINIRNVYFQGLFKMHHDKKHTWEKCWLSTWAQA